MNYPKLGEAIGLIFVAGLFLAAARTQELWPERLTAGLAFLRLLFVIIGLAFLFLAVVSVANWLAYNATSRYQELQRARAHTERVKIAEVVQRMTPEQITALAGSGYSLAFIPGSDGSVIALDIMTPGGAVPVPFFREFMGTSDEISITPVRSFSEGTAERVYAQRLTNMFTALGWAQPAAGNQAARWVNRAAAEAVLERVGG